MKFNYRFTKAVKVEPDLEKRKSTCTHTHTSKIGHVCEREEKEREKGKSGELREEI